MLHEFHRHTAPPRATPGGFSGSQQPSRAVSLSWEDWIGDRSPTLAVTLATNQNPRGSRQSTNRRLVRLVTELHRRVDRKLLGPRWFKKPPEARLQAFWTTEHLSSNSHLHGAVELSDELVERFSAIAFPIWRKLVPSGTVDVQLVTNAAGWAAYMMKEAHNQVSGPLVLPLR